MLEVEWEEWEESWAVELLVLIRDKESIGRTTETQQMATMETEQPSKVVEVPTKLGQPAETPRPVVFKLSLAKASD